MNSRTTQVDDLQLVALPSAVNCTDLFARFWLNEWSLSALFEDTSRAAHTLVGAVVESSDPQAPAFITVRLRLQGDCLILEVEDDHAALMHAEAPVVDGKRTGAFPLRGRGKLVWCELPLPSGVSADQVRLPQRNERYTQGSQVPEPASDEPVGPDPGLVDRVLVGLQRQE